MAAPFRFSMRQMFMAVALAAIALSFFRAEGCGGRWSLVTNLAYSPDGRSLAACCYECGDANVPMKGYIADVDRFITVYRLPEGDFQIAHRDFRGGNRGPGFGDRSYCPLHFSADGQRLHFLSWDSDQLLEWTRSDTRTSALLSLDPPQHSFAFFPDESRVALASGNEFAIVTLQDKRIERYPANGLSMYRSHPMAVSGDGKYIAFGGAEALHIWTVDPSPRSWRDFPADGYSWRYGQAVAFSPNQKWLAAAGNSVRLIDMTTGAEAILAADTRGQSAGVVYLGDSTKLAFANECVSLIDIHTKQVRDLPIEPPSHSSRAWPTALALSPDGNQLAIATGGGIALWDLAADKVVSELRLPSSFRVRWYIPWLALGVWCLAARRMWRTRKTA